MPVGTPDAFLELPEDPLGDLVSRYARSHGPFTTAEVASRLGLGEAVARQTLQRLAHRGRVLDGEREHVAVVLAGETAPAAVRLLDVLVTTAGVSPMIVRNEVLDGLHPGRGAVVEIAGVGGPDIGHEKIVNAEAILCADRHRLALKKVP